jgi:hypothetical protein
MDCVDITQHDTPDSVILTWLVWFGCVSVCSVRQGGELRERPLGGQRDGCHPPG